ncbi:hypothetical protein [Candidatus Spongiisocius sp.]|uniref:hypothetical protein n=1 Tax=Candidatus Spongiisocius sp. TaxID=3101273 RepID=UPI003B598102
MMPNPHPKSPMYTIPPNDIAANAGARASSKASECHAAMKTPSAATASTATMTFRAGRIRKG